MLNVTRAYALLALGALTLYFISGPLIFSGFWGGPSVPFPILGLLTLILPVLLIGRIALAWRGAQPFSNGSLLGFSLLTLTSLLAVVGAATNADVAAAAASGLFVRTITSSWVLWLGAEALIHASRRGWNVVMGVSIFALCAAIIGGIRIGAERYGEVALRFYDSATGLQFDYFSLTDPLALLGVLLLARLRNRPALALLAFAGIGALLFLGYSRTSLAMYVAGAALVAIRASSGAFWRGLGAAIILVVGVALVNLPAANLDVINTSVQRMGILVTDLDEDNSLIQREELQAEALGDLGRYWLLGQYAAEVIERGGGTYAHNWTSYWISYGLFPLLASLVLIGYGLRRAYLARDVGAFVLLLVAAGSIALSRAYVWPYVWFALSLAVHARLPVWASAEDSAPLGEEPWAEEPHGRVLA